MIATDCPRVAAGATPWIRTRLPSGYTSMSWRRSFAHAASGAIGRAWRGRLERHREGGPRWRGRRGSGRWRRAGSGATVTVIVAVAPALRESLAATVKVSPPTNPPGPAVAVVGVDRRGVRPGGRIVMEGQDVAPSRGPRQERTVSGVLPSFQFTVTVCSSSPGSAIRAASVAWPFGSMLPGDAKVTTGGTLVTATAAFATPRLLLESVTRTATGTTPSSAGVSDAAAPVASSKAPSLSRSQARPTIDAVAVEAAAVRAIGDPSGPPYGGWRQRRSRLAAR